MPKILERLVGQLQAKGQPKSNAFAIATSQLQKHGELKKGTQELTPKGAERQAMGAAGRAKDRAAKGSSHPTSDYSYSPKTNRATLKGYQSGGVVDDPELNEGDIYEQADLARIQRRQTQNIGRLKTEKQLENADRQKGREDARYRLDQYSLDQRDEMSPGEVLKEQADAARMQQRYTDHDRNWKPPPGGVPGYAKGGVVETLPRGTLGRAPGSFAMGGPPTNNKSSRK